MRKAPFLRASVFLTTLAFVICGNRALAQGTFPPPSDPQTPIMKTLSQVEPRTPVPAGGSFTISSAGSYYLTGNITTSTSGAGAAGITISSNDVTLDLNGFVVAGLNDTNVEDYCIRCTSSTNIVIRNGTVKNAANGVAVLSDGTGSGIRIEDVNCNRLFINGIYCHQPNNGVFICHCMVNLVGGATSAQNYCGIYANGGARIENCQVSNVKVPHAGSPGYGYGILAANLGISIGNSINSCDVGVSQAHCKSCVTLSCGIPYSACGDGGGNSEG